MATATFARMSENIPWSLFLQGKVTLETSAVKASGQEPNKQHVNNM
jgi:hypothetical protein